MKLYELSGDLADLRDIEEIENVQEVREIIEKHIQDKSEGIIKVIRCVESDVEAIKAEIDRLTKIKRIKENNIKRIRDYAKSCIETMGVKKITTPVGNMTLRKGTSTLKILDESLIPQEYIEKVEVIQIKKDLLKDDLKNGVIVDGAMMTEPGNTLMIK